MKGHPEEGLLQAYLDGEVSESEHVRVAGHLMGCAACNRTLDELGGLAAIAGSALAAVETRRPDVEAARWRVRREAATRRRRAEATGWGAGLRRRVAVAASFFLLFGVGVAAAMPGSPLRSWWDAREPAGSPVVSAASAPEDAAGPTEVGVGLELRDGALDVAFSAVPAGVGIEVTLVDGDRAAVFAPEGAHFETGSGRIHVEVGTVRVEAGSVRVEIPRNSINGVVRVNEAIYLEVVAGDLSFPGPPPSTTGDVIRFEVPAAGTPGGTDG